MMKDNEDNELSDDKPFTLSDECRANLRKLVSRLIKEIEIEDEDNDE